MTQTVETASEVVDAKPQNSGALKVLRPLEKIKAGLNALAKEGARNFDLTTVAGNKAARTFRMKCVELRSNVDSEYERLNKPLLEIQRQARALRDEVKASVKELEDPVDDAIKADEKRRERVRAEMARIEQLRIDAIRQRINEITATAPRAVSRPAAWVAERIEVIAGLAIGEDFAEFQSEAERAREETLATLRGLHADKVLQEEEAARLAAERAELERQRAEIEAREARRQEIATRLQRLRSIPNALVDRKPETIRLAIGLLEGSPVDDEWAEYKDEAETARTYALTELRRILEVAVVEERRAAEDTAAQRLAEAVAAEQAEKVATTTPPAPMVHEPTAVAAPAVEQKAQILAGGYMNLLALTNQMRSVLDGLVSAIEADTAVLAGRPGIASKARVGRLMLDATRELSSV